MLYHRGYAIYYSFISNYYQAKVTTPNGVIVALKSRCADQLRADIDNALEEV